MTIGEYLHRSSHREHLVFLAWLDMQWDRPARIEYYLMQVAAEVRRTLVRNPAKVDANDFQLKFKVRGEEKPVTPEQFKKNVEANKKMWLGIVGAARPTEEIKRRPLGS
jgi:hypothetical protein